MQPGRVMLQVNLGPLLPEPFFNNLSRIISFPGVKLPDRGPCTFVSFLSRNLADHQQREKHFFPGLYQQRQPASLVKH